MANSKSSYEDIRAVIASLIKVRLLSRAPMIGTFETKPFLFASELIDFMSHLENRNSAVTVSAF